ncbi:SdrD B-like protein [Anaerobacterium chartisolvens]|uniref:SdrD B-like protein n=1 Tax=Anaerobacterium chartisolvens TaxID=1297424 RepID=A0A369B1P8_9FIRM|nr:MXAN_6640 family putative metalloprotease [Anaerobacterium chartisolvens]RCX14337.1 SdrD B-like protein [Anaerobacterium chartisolvens]
MHMITRDTAKKVIKGVVYKDSNHNNTVDKDEQVLPGVTVNLYRSDPKNKIDPAKDDGVFVIKERLISSVKTDENGEYSFDADGGKYTVNLDINTLPEGTGAINTDIYIDEKKASVNDFALRDVASIELKTGDIQEVEFNEDFSLNMVLKDRDGNILAGKVRYLFDNRQLSLEDSRFCLRHNDLQSVKLNVNISAGSVTRQVLINTKIPEVSSEGKVRMAFENGILDEKKKILHYLHSIFDSQKLTREYRSSVPIKSATTMIKEIYDYILGDNADSEIKREAERYISSPPKLDRAYTSKSGYFKIHYTLSGANAVSAADTNRSGIPDYIESVGAAFDNSRNITCETRGFKAPVLDPGKKDFDIYVYDLRGIYGVMFPKTFYGTSSWEPRTSSCYICIDNSYAASKGFKKSRNDCMRVTAAHEFFHAVQNAYNADADSWWKEATATWNEDEIYTSINDYIQYIDRVFSNPQKSLEQSNYGGVIFAKYLSENMGGHKIIKRVWELQAKAHRNSLNAINDAIREINPKDGIETAFERFAACNFNPAQYYKEGALWTSALKIKNIYTAYPVGHQSGRLDHMASCYVLFKPSVGAAGKNLKITVERRGDRGMKFKLQKRKRSDDSCEISDVQLSGRNSRAQIICESFGEMHKEICLIPVNVHRKTDRIYYNYSVNT